MHSLVGSLAVSISGHGQRMGDETGIVMQKRQRVRVVRTMASRQFRRYSVNISREAHLS